MRLSLSVKAAIYLTIIASLLIAYVASAIIADGRQFMRDRLDIVVQGRGEHATAILISKPADDAAAALTSLLETISHFKYITYADVIDTQGQVIATGHLPARPFVGDEGIVETAIRTRAVTTAATRHQIHFAYPLVDGDRVIGALRMGYRLAYMDAFVGGFARSGLIAAVLGIALAAPITTLLMRRMLRPVNELTDAFADVAARNFNRFVEVRTGDELEVLATAYNNMVAQLRSSLQRIQWLAYRDDLTGLRNRHAFLVRTARFANADDPCGAIILVDLDGFKRFNNTLGESEGDRILTVAAERLRTVMDEATGRDPSAFTAPPTLARLSGDLFAVMAPTGSPTATAKALAESILGAFSAPTVITGQSLNLSASIGVARFPLDGDDPERVLRHANLALDAAKAEGGASVRFFEPDMTRRAMERVTLDNELRQAVEAGEFEVHYQPKVDARRGGIVGAEALVRWRRQGQLVFPGKFIEAAEESGLIGDIGQFVLEESCRAAARWRDLGLTADVAVNVSAIQFERPDFSRIVEAALSQAGLEPERLELELTESVAMTDPDQVLEQVRSLRARGVRFAIDDFGTGHSSLASLTRLPFDVFKIDQSFVRNMDEDANARIVIETILAMARALGCQTVAEGVESPTQYAFLRVSGCTYAQGWFFGKPQREDQFVEMLKADQRGGTDSEDAPLKHAS